MTQYKEINFDGIVGPTHNYGGLSYGNTASMNHQCQISNPKEAALQGIAKMRLLHKLGIPQGVFPPHERPYFPLFYALGYRGSHAEIVGKIAKESPELLAAASSSAHMWTANAATVSPSCDTQDHRVHFTPANLISKLHRSYESETTSALLKIVFSDPTLFQHHAPLPSNEAFADEGAANHVRLSSSHGSHGTELFVFGRHAFMKKQKLPQFYPARQTDQASKAIARLHQLDHRCTHFVQQNSVAIDAGVFHNDVISTGNENVFFFHEEAFNDTLEVIAFLKNTVDNICFIPVKTTEISLKESVQTYLFNSQLVTISDQTMVLIAPEESRNSVSAHRFLEKLLQRNDHPIRRIIYVNLKESMQNGGGPACLRLRIVLNEQEMAAIKPSVLFNEQLDTQLVNWVNRHYRDRLHPKDLADPQLVEEIQQALVDLTTLLQLGSIYSFMQT